MNSPLDSQSPGFMPYSVPSPSPTPTPSLFKASIQVLLVSSLPPLSLPLSPCPRLFLANVQLNYSPNNSFFPSLFLLQAAQVSGLVHMWPLKLLWLSGKPGEIFTDT
ncbi:endophilin-A1 [Platysternon megacephalum]|uniref:Endophilin-A1 n=1 Tax=Platysternon megacephalum TaxID=55544 RepID=A0A4D9F7V8_9SAUR|nr:endophilin-A1 [Platysternon megacephalum]